MECPNKVLKINKLLCNYAITQSLFELQNPDIAWNFIWSGPINYAK